MRNSIGNRPLEPKALEVEFFPMEEVLAKYGGMDVSIISRMKELEEENRRLKKMYLEERLKAEIVSEALEKKW